MITISEILEQMKTGKPFSCTVISFDRKRKKGGEKVEYPEAILVQSTAAQNPTKGVRPATPTEKKIQALQQLKRNPNHKSNFSRNIRILQDGHPTGIIRKIHPPLIIEWNGDKEVTP